MKPTEKLTQAAFSIINRFSQSAYWNGDSCSWLVASTDLANPQKAEYRMMSYDIYSGTSGIAYLYSIAYNVSKDPFYKKYAMGALNHALQLSTKERSFQESFYSGLVGLAYVCMHAGKLLNEEKYLVKGIEIIDRVCSIPEDKYGIDVINGPAGSIGKLITLKETIYPDLEIEELITRFCNYYISRKMEYKGFTVWNTMPECVAPMTGFAHGMSGIAGGLLEAYRFLKKEAYRSLAESTMEYENKCFDPSALNWPDFRHFERDKKYEPSFAMAWCHGAPGIGLQRLRAATLTQNTVWLKDATAAVEKTHKNAVAALNTKSGNFSLCHGIFGNNELLIEYAKVHHKPEYYNSAVELAHKAIDEIEDNGHNWPSGLHNQQETSSFMLGLPGTAYHLFRLCDPQIPCVLAP